MLGVAAAVFSALLVVTGVAKLIRPGETSRAVAVFGLPSHPGVGFVIGLSEVLVGSAALVTANSLAFAIQALLYAGFVVWVVAALRLDTPLSSCGCLGRDDTPPYWGHLTLDLLAFLVSAGAAALGAESLELALSLASATQWAIVGVGVFLAWVVIDDGAKLAGAMRRP